MTLHPARLAAALALAALAALPRPADACQPVPDIWEYWRLEPRVDDEAVMPTDGPLVFAGTFSGTATYAQLMDALQITVRAEGEAVDGALAPIGATGLIGWTPAAPLAAGQVLSVEFTLLDERAEVLWEVPADEVVRVIDAPRVATTGALSIEEIMVEAMTVHGRCVEEGFCGDCVQRERLGERGIWRAHVRGEIDDGLYAVVQQHRIATGADPAEALAVLDRTPLQRGGLGDIFLSGGVLDGWPSDEGCVAVEVRRPRDDAPLREVRCAPLPAHEHLITPKARREAPAAAPAAREAAACAVEPGVPASGIAGLLVLLGLVARRRLALLALIAFGALGCEPVEPDGASLDAATLDGEIGDPDDPDGGVDLDLPPQRDGGPEDGSAPCFELECTADGRRALPPLAEAPGVPPISGGTLAVSPALGLAVAADPARDRVHLVDLATAERRATFEQPGQPGRVAIDEARGLAHVALRAADAVLTIDLARQRAETHPTCGQPRGLAVGGDRLYVACADGRLATHDPDGALRDARPLAPDLRDVVVTADGRVHVSRFAAAELITLDAGGEIVARRRPATADVADDPDATAPVVAWRTRALDDGRIAMLHQRARLAPIVLDRGEGYGSNSPCGAISAPTVTLFESDPAADPVELVRVAGVTLAVDLVYDAARGLVLATPGNVPTLRRPASTATVYTWQLERGGCVAGDPVAGDAAAGEITSVARWGDTSVLLGREPAALYIGDRAVALGGESVFDTGHDLFHKDAGGGIACATCHPEGTSDDHPWVFDGFGIRRTQTLVGGLADTAPFHWAGDMRDLDHLLGEVMTRRMNGPVVPPAYSDALLGWLDGLRSTPTAAFGPGDPVEGAALFEDPMVGCAGCHSGPRLADGQRYDVGTGGRFETATLLGVGRRAALMHDGCGQTLADRFDPACGGGEAHGRTAHLDDDQLADLIAYLTTL